MATLSRNHLDQAVHLCGGSFGDALYSCLDPFWSGQSSAVRGMKETLIRSLGIQVVALASYGHLLSLQDMPRSGSLHLILLPLFFFLHPELAIVQLLVRTIVVSFRALRNGRTPFRYFLGACFGMHARCSPSSDQTTPLLDIPHQELQSEVGKYGVLWIGRLVLLLALLAQYSGSAVLWFRRTSHYHDRGGLINTTDRFVTH